MGMLDEIFDEPNAIKRTFYQLKDSLEETIKLIKESKRIYVIGNGSSYHAALYLQYIFQMEGLNVQAFTSNELKYYIKNIGENDLCIAISQSGENKDVLNASKTWYQKNKRIISFVNNKDSSLSSISLISNYISAGVEQAIPATKSFISSITAILILHDIYKNEINLKNKILDLSRAVEQIISEKEEIRKISEIVNEKSMILGTFLNYITAKEAALKLIETSNVFSLAYPAGEIFHGPIQILDKNTVLFLLVGNEYLNFKDKINKIVPFVNIIDLGKENADFNIKFEYENVDPIVNVIPFQLISYFVAKRKGLDPDRPTRIKKIV